MGPHSTKRPFPSSTRHLRVTTTNRHELSLSHAHTGTPSSHQGEEGKGEERVVLAMGALFSCFSKEQQPQAKGKKNNNKLNGKRNFPLVPDGRGNGGDRVLTNEEALVAARLLIQDAAAIRSTSRRVDRSTSSRIAGEVEDRKFKKNGQQQQHQDGVSLFLRSSSTRPRSNTDPLIQPHQLLNQDVKVSDLETAHFVLVHGGGFGAWCWYKTIALLEESGFKVDALDLAGSGVDSFNTHKITSLSEYTKPLTEFMKKLEEGQKVILVGHDFGGACISIAMEIFPEKIAKAIFLSALMLKNGQSILDAIPQEEGVNDEMRKSQIFIYANGNNHPPTSIDLNKAMVKNLLFNQSPAKDIALASVSMRTIPFAPVLEKLSLSDKNYGSIRKYYIETTEDNAIPLTLQQSMSNSNQLERVFLLKGSDHAPFFSKPQGLHKLLVDIAKIQPTAKSHLPTQGRLPSE